jgi:undecaprenyl-diphosphatase
MTTQQYDTSYKVSGRAWQCELLVVVGLIAAYLILLFMIDHTAPTTFDRWFTDAIQSIPWGAFGFVPDLGSDLGAGADGFFVVPGPVATGFALARRWRLLALLVVLFALHYVMISPKQFVLAYRPSPLFGVEGADGLESFPSGHVQWATSFYGLLAYLMWREASGRLRHAILPVNVLIVVGTILGRIALGRHWPLDTLAGLTAGLISLRLLIALHGRFADRRIPAFADT